MYIFHPEFLIPDMAFMKPSLSAATLLVIHVSPQTTISPPKNIRLYCQCEGQQEKQEQHPCNSPQSSEPLAEKHPGKHTPALASSGCQEPFCQNAATQLGLQENRKSKTRLPSPGYQKNEMFSILHMQKPRTSY